MLVLYLKNIAKSKTGAIWVDIAAIDVYEVKTSTEPAATKAVTAFVAHYSTSICPLLSSEALLKKLPNIHRWLNWDFKVAMSENNWRGVLWVGAYQFL